MGGLSRFLYEYRGTSQVAPRGNQPVLGRNILRILLSLLGLISPSDLPAIDWLFQAIGALGLENGDGFHFNEQLVTADICLHNDHRNVRKPE